MKLPKPYLSYSALNAFLSTSTRRTWIKRYIYKEPFFTSKEMIFGKRVSEALESENLFEVDDDLVDVISQVQTDETPEVCLVLQQNGYYIIGYLDSCKDNYSHFTEFKTGKGINSKGEAVGWTQEKVDNYLQLDTYALLIYEAFGILPKCTLVWMETIDASVDGGIEFTGKIEKFERDFTKREIDDCKKLFYDSAVEMEQIYQAHLEGYDFTDAKEARVLIKEIQAKL